MSAQECARVAGQGSTAPHPPEPALLGQAGEVSGPATGEPIVHYVLTAQGP